VVPSIPHSLCRRSLDNNLAYSRIWKASSLNLGRILAGWKNFKLGSGFRESGNLNGKVVMQNPDIVFLSEEEMRAIGLVAS